MVIHIPKIEVTDLNVYFEKNHALKNVDIKINEKEITAIIGPSGCGKSTFIRCINRMNDLVMGCTVKGAVVVDGKDIYAKGVDAVEVRKRIGMVFQRPNPFPKSMFENIAYAPRLHGFVDEKGQHRNYNKQQLHEIVEWSLKRAALWDEVSDRLEKSAYNLSGGQQQRLCIARAMAIEPEIMLMDEPCSALDPIATAKIEDLLIRPEKGLHDRHRHPQHAAGRPRRRHDGILLSGELIEFGETKQIFEKPEKDLTEQYITGRMG